MKRFLLDDTAMGAFGRIVILYFFVGVAVNVFAPTLFADTQEILGVNETSSSTALNTSEMDPEELANSLPEDPTGGSSILPSGASLLISGLSAAWNSVVLAMSVMTWPAIAFSSYGAIGIAIGWGFTLMFFVALFMFIRGVT